MTMKLLPYLSILTAATAVPAVTSTSGCESLPSAGPISTVAQFPNGTWVENLAVRSDGTVLASIYEPEARLMLIFPDEGGRVETIHTFSDSHSGMGGIVELGSDIFYFVTFTRGSGIANPPPGTGKVWRVDLSKFHGAESPVTLVSNITDSLFPNGLAATQKTNQILVPDSQRGVIWRVDPISGTFSVAANDSALRNTSAADPRAIGIGVNGIHTDGDLLYFTNTDKQLYGRFEIDEKGIQTGPVEILEAEGLVGVDDFALFHAPGAIIADDLGSGGNRTIYVSGDGRNCSTILAHVAGPTATKLYRSSNGTITVFVSTHGGLDPLMGTLSKFELN